MTISEGFETYRLEFIVFKNLSPETEESYITAYRSLVRFCGDISIESLDFETIRKWKAHMTKDKAPVTVRGYIISLRVVLRYLQKKGMAVLDPKTIPIPLRPPPNPEFIEPHQVQMLIDANDNIVQHKHRIRNKLIISLLFSTGIRVGELCSLDIANIKFGDSFSVAGKGTRRPVFMDERTKAFLAEYLKMRTEGYPVYVNRGGKRTDIVRYTVPPDNHPALILSNLNKRITPGEIQLMIRNSRQKAGIVKRVSPHTVRHSFATDLLRNNCNMRYVQALLGHKSLQTTQMYTHVVDEDLHKAHRQHHTVS